jgi:hypothetical protein
MLRRRRLAEPVFAQFTEILVLVNDKFARLWWPFLTLSGATPARKRGGLVNGGRACRVRADGALCEAKRAGRDGYRVWVPGELLASPA